MLQLIRDRAQGIVIWTIVGLIIITFALFGLSSYLSDSSRVSVASINGAEVTPADFQRAYQNYQQRLQQMLGDKYRPELFQEDKVKKAVLDSLIQQELLNQELAKAGYHPAPEQIVQRISAMEVFQEDGKFSPERYKQILASQRINSFMFEQQIARDLAEQQLTSGMLLSGFVTKDELDRFARLLKQKRELAYLHFSRSRYLDKIEPGDAELQAYYDEHKEDFTTPEKISVEYVELNLDDLAREVEISDEQVAEYYAQQRDSLTQQPEQRKARHILIRVGNSEQEKAAREKLQTIQDKLAAGEDFAELAKSYSEDIGSAKQGGDLGYFGRGVMDKAFEDAVFALKKGEVSEPVRSRFGYHLIKLEDIRKAKRPSLEDIKEKLRHELQIQQAEQTFYEQVDKLNNVSYEIPDSLAPVAESLGLELKTSPLFSREGGKGLFASPKVVTAAFSEEVLNEGRNSQLVELTDTHVLVLRKAEHVPAKQLTLDEVRAQVQQRVRDEKATGQIMADAKAALERLRAGEDPVALARSMKAEWKQAGAVARTGDNAGQTLSPRIRQQLFRMPRPAGNGKSYASLLLNNGDAAVLVLSKVIEVEPFDDQERLAEQLKLSNVYARTIQSAWMAELRAQADITTHLDSLE